MKITTLESQFSEKDATVTRLEDAAANPWIANLESDVKQKDSQIQDSIER